MSVLSDLTAKYATVLRQLLPYGGYDTAPGTVIHKDITGHAKALAQVQLDGERLLTAIDAVPVALLVEYEREYGLPLKCTVPASMTTAERLEILNAVMSERNTLNREYLETLLARYGVVLDELVTYKPMQCTAPCTAPVNTEQLRFKVLLKLVAPVAADMDCIIENYLPAYLRVDIEEV